MGTGRAAEETGRTAVSDAISRSSSEIRACRAATSAEGAGCAPAACGGAWASPQRRITVISSSTFLSDTLCKAAEQACSPSSTDRIRSPEAASACFCSLFSSSGRQTTMPEGSRTARQMSRSRKWAVSSSQIRPVSFARSYRSAITERAVPVSPARTASESWNICSRPAMPAVSATTCGVISSPAAMHWSSRDRASRIPPSERRAMRFAASSVRDTPSSAAI